MRPSPRGNLAAAARARSPVPIRSVRNPIPRAAADGDGLDCPRQRLRVGRRGIGSRLARGRHLTVPGRPRRCRGITRLRARRLAAKTGTRHRAGRRRCKFHHLSSESARPPSSRIAARAIARRERNRIRHRRVMAVVMEVGDIQPHDQAGIRAGGTPAAVGVDSRAEVVAIAVVATITGGNRFTLHNRAYWKLDPYFILSSSSDPLL